MTSQILAPYSEELDTCWQYNENLGNLLAQSTETFIDYVYTHKSSMLLPLIILLEDVRGTIQEKLR